MRLAALTRCLLLLLCAAHATAQTSNISLDGSLPHGRTDVLTGPGTGPDYTIGEDLGWRAGPNLFHSFRDFSIGVNESATFTENAGMPALSHVIARVTGGDPSVIDGALRSEIAGADFYFLNPSGVLFGGTASIDVPAAFTVSTAHRLHFEGTGAFLDLLDADSPSLWVEAPSAFGFLDGGPRAPIVFSNPAGAFDVREYAVGEGETLSAVGGDVSVQNRVRLRATKGRVQLAAVGNGIGEVPLDFADLDPAGLDGDVSISGRSEILAVTSDRSANQGTVVIRGGRLIVEDASIVRAGDFVGADGASIDVATSEAVRISGAGTLVRSEAPGSRPSGGIRIASDSVVISDGGPGPDARRQHPEWWRCTAPHGRRSGDRGRSDRGVRRWRRGNPHAPQRRGGTRPPRRRHAHRRDHGCGDPEPGLLGRCGRRSPAPGSERSHPRCGRRHRGRHLGRCRSDRDRGRRRRRRGRPCERAHHGAQRRGARRLRRRDPDRLWRAR